MSQEQTQKSSIGAWKKQTPRGEVVNFTINGQRYNMWVNSNKTKENQPDFNIVEDNYVKPQQPQVAVQSQQYVPQQPQYIQPQQQYVQPQQPQVQQPQQGFVPANNGLNF